jgi:ubiquinone/menaquinone biosynthesis C-methylase UbiE
MVDLTKLPPDEVARHLGNPDSETGIAVAEYMNRANRTLSEAAYRRLNVAASQHVLEIGFGNGQFIAMLVGMAEATRYAGVDISRTMVDQANAANRTLAEAGRVDIRLASVDALPFASATFDRAVGVNTLYFWPDPVAGLKELRRVLKPEGLLLLACVSPETAATSPWMKQEFGFSIHGVSQITELHRAAGFSDVVMEPYSETGRRMDGTPYPRNYNFSIARA